LRVVNIEPERFSFGRSLNLGIAEARNEIVVIASAHVYPVYPDWLERLIAPFEDTGIGLTYGRQRGNTKTHISEQQIFEHWYPNRSEIRHTNPFCNNANAAIRRRLWEEHQYDESLSGLEDLDLANWVIERGLAIAYVAEAEIIHVHEESPRDVYNRYRREAMAFKRLFPREHFNLVDFLRLFTSNVTSDIAFAIREGKVSLELSNILWFRFMQFWGTYKGYRQSGPLTWELRQTFYYPMRNKSMSKLQPRRVNPIQYNDVT
jgi:rhamnosyltransferase